MAEFRLKFKKVGKTPGPFRYDLNQIPYDYTVEVRNRFKGGHDEGELLDFLDIMGWNHRVIQLGTYTILQDKG